MPTCPYCNELNPADVGICKKCGGTIPLEETTAEGLNDFDQQILELMKGGKKIAAIKLYREKTGQGLKEAKDSVEALAAKHGIESKAAGCAGMVLLLILLPVVWWFL